MKAGDIELARIPQDAYSKLRPVLLLKEMPNYNDFLVCAISSQLWQYIPHFDQLILSNDEDFAGTGLLRSSVVRLSVLAIKPSYEFEGAIGKLTEQKLEQLLKTLSDYLVDG